MASRQYVRSLFLGILITLFTFNLYAAHGHIAGRISRESGSGIGGVIVQVVETGDVQLSDANGDFRFEIAPGSESQKFVD